MNWNLDKDRPICPQICEQLCVGIACGELTPNSKLYSVREIAVQAGVNPNTVQKSFEQLESKGLIFSVRGSGWFVKDNIEEAKATVNDIIKKKTESYFKEMAALGFSKSQIKKYVEEWNK